MADDNLAINSGISPLIWKLFIYRDQCQDRLASVKMLPADYARYTQLTGNYFIYGVSLYAEFRREMFDLLEQNPNYAHLRVYWVDYDRFITQGIPLVDSLLFNYPIFLHANMGIPIPPANIGQFQDVLSELCNYFPEQSRIPVAQEVRDRELACKQELDRIEQWSRQQEMVRQEQMAWQQQMARQQEMALRQEYTVREEQLGRLRFRASEDKRREKQREDSKRRAENKIRRQRERELALQSSTDSSTDSVDDGA